jgi:hypothetical protein
MKIEIFEPNLCCSTGVCGPAPDRALINLQELVHQIQQTGTEIRRYAINQQPLAFTSNETIRTYIREKGTHNFPVTLVNGQIVLENRYPSLQDLQPYVPSLKDLKPSHKVISVF